MADPTSNTKGKRIAFICAALAPGRDGVGDYSRRLAGEFIRQNRATTIIALNDTHVSGLTVEQQEIEGINIPVLRLPSLMPWYQRQTEARAFLDKFNPDWVSFQFVPFGFDNRGLRFGLGKTLAAINGKAAWHVMFHELWLGLGEKSPAKHHIIGALQKHIILDFMKRLHPGVVHTQAEPYRIALKRKNVSAAILPLFGNIPRTDGDGWNSILRPLVAQAAGQALDRNEVYLAGILGMVHPEWNADHAVKVLLPKVLHGKKRLVLVFHGKNGLSDNVLRQIGSGLHGRAVVIVTGERSRSEISEILQALDLGLATSPREVIQKSGSAIAMLEHGLNVLITRDDWHLRGSGLETPPESMSPKLLLPDQFAALDSLPVRDTKAPEFSGVKLVANRMLAALDSASVNA